MTAWKVGCCLALGLLASGVAFANETPWNGNVELTVTSDDNLTRAEADRDRVEDASAFGAASLAWTHEFGMMSSGSLEAFAEREVYDTVDSLDRTSGGARAIFRWQRHLGFTAPFFQVSASAQHDDVATDQRDSDLYVMQAFATRRLTDVVTGTVGLEARQRYADDRVFDQGERRLFVNADYALGTAWAVYGTLSYAQGDTFSSAQRTYCSGAPATGIYPLLYAADAIEPDEAMNKALCGDWLVYRLQGNTALYSVGINRGFGHSLALDLNATQVSTRADEGIHYGRTMLRASLFARF